MHERFTDPEFGAAALAEEAHLSLRSTQLLLAEAGTSPAAAIRRLRLELAGRLLARGASVGGACTASGFGDAGSFARRFRAHFGVAPSAYREAGSAAGR
ncbi:helix-turn-helix domain-containing protein [Mycetocola reblochoni]|nr:helix-turn-helix domain-containing protein [Mycetocola reblochoni]